MGACSFDMPELYYNTMFEQFEDRSSLLDDKSHHEPRLSTQHSSRRGRCSAARRSDLLLQRPKVSLHPVNTDGQAVSD